MQRGKEEAAHEKPTNLQAIKELRAIYEGIRSRFQKVFDESAHVLCKDLLPELYQLGHSVSTLQVLKKEANQKSRLDFLIKILIFRIDTLANLSEEKFISIRFNNFHKTFTEKEILRIPFENDVIWQRELFAVAQLVFNHSRRSLIEPTEFKRLYTDLFKALSERSNDAFIQLLSIYSKLVLYLKSMGKTLEPLSGELLKLAWLGFTRICNDEEGALQRCYKQLESDHRESQPDNVAVALKFAVASIYLFRWQQARAYFMVNQKNPDTASVSITNAQAFCYSLPFPQLTIDKGADLSLLMRLVKISNKLVTTYHYLEAVQLLASLDGSKRLQDCDSYLTYFAIAHCDGLYCADEGKIVRNDSIQKRKLFLFYREGIREKV